MYVCTGSQYHAAVANYNEPDNPTSGTVRHYVDAQSLYFSYTSLYGPCAIYFWTNNVSLHVFLSV